MKLASATKIVTLLLGLSVLSLVISTSPAVAAPDVSKLKVGDQVRLELRNGGTVEGTIVSVDAKALGVKTKFGKLNVKKDEITTFEKVKTAQEIYDERAKTCKAADDWFKLGRAMEGMNEFDLRDKAYGESLKLDPDHEPTRNAQGEVMHDGKWMPLEDAMKAQGKVKHRGEWLTPEKLAEAKAKEVAALKARKMKGQNALEQEYIGRPYALVDPVETDNYEIWCLSTEEVAREYAAYMEALHERYSSVFKKFKKYRSGRAKITIQANKQQFMDWTGQSEGVGGFYMPHLGDVWAFHGSFGTTGSTYEVLAHEGTHQFEGYILNDFNACPMWVIEGLAVFFGDGSEYDGRKVKIGIIPRDRLAGLQRIIQSGQYGTIQLDRLFRVGYPFSGYYYAPAWGIIYWCLWGDQSKPQAHKGGGMGVFADFFLPISKAKGMCNYDKEAKRFIGLLEQETGKSKDEWEEDYKDWILKLPLEQLMKKKAGGRWVSEKLGFEVKKPGGWKFDKNVRRNEQVAFLAAGSKHRRISTFVWSNWDRANLSEALANNVIGNCYTIDSSADDDDCIEATLRESVGGFPAVEMIFYGTPRVGGDSSTGGPGGEQDTAKEELERVKVRAVVYATVDKIRANVFESVPDAQWGATNTKYFDRYLKDFKADEDN